MFYLNIFLIYSIIGHFLEITIQTIFINSSSSGILFLPWTPIYGIGALIILLTYKTIFKNLHTKKWIEIIIAFIIVSILLSIIEFIGGILIEKIFGTIFWDYSNQKYHFGKYASLEMTLLWGIASLILYYILHPILNKIITKIPKIVTYVLGLMFFIDLVITIITKIY